MRVSVGSDYAGSPLAERCGLIEQDRAKGETFTSCFLENDGLEVEGRNTEFCNRPAVCPWPGLVWLTIELALMPCALQQDLGEVCLEGNPTAQNEKPQPQQSKSRGTDCA